MKISAEQMKVLSKMKCGSEHTARNLGCRYTTLGGLAALRLVAESLRWRIWAAITGVPRERRFTITDAGLVERDNKPMMSDEQVGAHMGDLGGSFSTFERDTGGRP